MINSRLLLCGASWGALLMPAAVAMAQDGTEQASTDSETPAIEELTVTARKQDESLLEVPVAITAFSEKALESRAIEDLEEIADFTPGFQYQSFGAFPGRFDNSPRFRGIVVNSQDPSRQTASVFVDGIYVSGGAQGISLDDIERVEVIKGPQSAYFGRNTFGGAINYITKTPGADFEGSATAEVASRDEYAGSVRLSFPIAGDSLAASVSASYRDKAGHYNSANDGAELGAEETWSVAGTLYFEPSDNFSVKLRGNYFENDDGPPAFYEVGLDDHNCGPFGGAQDDTFFCGFLPVFAPSLNTDLPQSTIDALNGLNALHGQNLTRIGLTREATRLSAAINFEIPGTGITFVSLTGHNNEDASFLRDADGSDTFAFMSFFNREFVDTSQEIRLLGSLFDDKLNWTIGGNFIDQRIRSQGAFIFAPALVFGNAPTAEENIETKGVFGSLIWEVADNLRLTLEGRYQEDEISNDADISGGEEPLGAEFTNFLPRAIVDYMVTDSTLLYASYSEGNLPGGNNPEILGLSPTELETILAIEPSASVNFEEEKLENFELGLKHGFDIGGYVSVALYHMKRSNQTVRRSDIITRDGGNVDFIDYFVNIGKSDINGIEVEGSFPLADWFTLDGSLSYNDSEFKVFQSGNVLEVFGDADAAGKESFRFPPLTASLGASFQGDLSPTMDWFARADVIYTGDYFTSEVNLAEVRGGEQINLRAGLETDAYRLEAFVTNLTDSDVPTASNLTRDLTLGFDFSRYGWNNGLRDKRQFGVRARVNF